MVSPQTGQGTPVRPWTRRPVFFSAFGGHTSALFSIRRCEESRRVDDGHDYTYGRPLRCHRTSVRDGEGPWRRQRRSGQQVSTCG